MKHYNGLGTPSQARKQKLAENLTGAQHGYTSKRSSKTIVRTSEIAKHGGGLQ